MPKAGAEIYRDQPKEEEVQRLGRVVQQARPHRMSKEATEARFGRM